MLIYFIILLIIVLLGLILKPNFASNNTNKKIFIIITFILLFCVSGFRNKNVGVDTLQYYNAFKRISLIDISNFNVFRYEYGFTFLCWILSKISNNPQILLIVTSFFINYSILRFIYKHSNNVFISVLIYVLLNFYFSYMNIMRQAIAISIVLWGYDFIIENKNIKFVLTCLFASLFHESALLAILLLIPNYFRFNKKMLFCVFVFVIVAFFYGEKFFIFLSNYSPRLLEYTNSKYNVSNYFGALLDALVYVLTYIIGLLTIKKNSNQLSNITAIKEKNMMLGILGMACIFQSLVIKVSIFNRFSPYFTIFIILWIPHTIEKITNKKRKTLYYLTLLFIFFLYWLIIMLFRPQWYGVVPYSLFI